MRTKLAVISSGQAGSATAAHVSSLSAAKEDGVDADAAEIEALLRAVQEDMDDADETERDLETLDAGEADDGD
jgi:hypothetical protein